MQKINPSFVLIFIYIVLTGATNKVLKHNYKLFCVFLMLVRTDLMY